jgi:hypothetical protein
MILVISLCESRVLPVPAMSSPAFNRAMSSRAVCAFVAAFSASCPGAATKRFCSDICQVRERQMEQRRGMRL